MAKKTDKSVSPGSSRPKKGTENLPADASRADDGGESASAGASQTETADQESSGAASDADETRLPWLQKVEEEPASRGRGPAGTFIAAVGVAVAALVLLLLFFPTHRSGTASPSENAANAIDQNLISESGPENGTKVAQAPAAPAPHRDTTSKVRAARHAHSPSASAIATRKAPAASPPPAHASAAPPRTARAETRNTRPEPQKTVRKAHEKIPAHAAPTPTARAVSRPAGQIVQIGAFASRTAAERAWSRLGGMAGYRGGRPRIERAVVHGRTFYRLRVALPSRRNACVTSRRTCFLVPTR